MLFILKRFQASFVIPKQQRVNSGKLVAPYAKKMHLKTYSNEAATAYDNYNSTCCLLIHHHYQGSSINDVKQYFPPNFLSLNLHLPKKGPFVYNYFFNKVFFSENIMVLLSTVAVWPENPFSLLLMRPQGPQGCQMKRNHSLNMPLEVWCAKIDPKLNKLEKNHQN